MKLGKSSNGKAQEKKMEIQLLQQQKSLYGRFQRGTAVDVYTILRAIMLTAADCCRLTFKCTQDTCIQCLIICMMLIYKALRYDRHRFTSDDSVLRTCHPHTYQHMERATPAFTPQPQSIATLPNLI